MKQKKQSEHSLMMCNLHLLSEIILINKKSQKNYR